MIFSFINIIFAENITKFSKMSKISKISRIYIMIYVSDIIDIFVRTLTFVHTIDCLFWKQSDGSILVEILDTPGSCSDDVVNRGVIWNVSGRCVCIECVRSVIWRRNVHRQTFVFIIITNKISIINLMLRLLWAILVTFVGWWLLYVFWTLPAKPTTCYAYSQRFRVHYMVL